jgi:hypothetical protein
MAPLLSASLTSGKRKLSKTPFHRALSVLQALRQLGAPVSFVWLDFWIS